MTRLLNFVIRTQEERDETEKVERIEFITPTARVPNSLDAVRLNSSVGSGRRRSLRCYYTV